MTVSEQTVDNSGKSVFDADTKSSAAPSVGRPKAFVDIVFDGPPSHESGRFIEVENSDGKSISIGEWLQRPDGYWVLRVPRIDCHDELVAALNDMLRIASAASYGVTGNAKRIAKAEAVLSRARGERP